MASKLDYSFTHRFTRDEYTELRSTFAKNSRSYRLIILAAVGIAFLFWHYTFLIGIALLLLFTLAILAPGIINFGARSEYDSTEYLHYTLTYHFTDQGLSVRGENGLSASCNWNNHVHWKEQRGWIIFTATGMPWLYVLASDAKKHGAYESLLELARRFGRKIETGRGTRHIHSKSKKVQ